MAFNFTLNTGLKGHMSLMHHTNVQTYTCRAHTSRELFPLYGVASGGDLVGIIDQATLSS